MEYLIPPERPTIVSSGRGHLAFWFNPRYCLAGGRLLEEIVREVGWERPSIELACLVSNLLTCLTADRQLRGVVCMVRRSPRKLVRVTSAGWQPGSHRHLAAIDALVGAGLAQQVLGNRGSATELSPTQAFVDLIRWQHIEFRPTWDRATIEVRAHVDGERVLAEYDPAAAQDMLVELAAINRLNDRFDYTATYLAPISLPQTGGSRDRAGSGKNTTPGGAAEPPARSARRVVAGGDAAGSVPPGPASGSGEAGSFITGRIFESVVNINAHLQKAILHYRRIFHGLSNELAFPNSDIPKYVGGWGHHGRFYSSFQSLSGEERRTLRVDGEPVVELDISGCMPRILYNMLGLEAPRDPYSVEGLDPRLRDVYKKATLILLNTYSRKQALAALRAWLKEVNAKRPLRRRIQAATVLRHMEEAHAPIADMFYRESGNRIMNLDSQVTAGVFRRFVDYARRNPRDAAPVLAIHDGYIVPVRAELRLYEAIRDSYAEVLDGWTPVLKRTAADGREEYVSDEYYYGPVIRGGRLL